MVGAAVPTGGLDAAVDKLREAAAAHDSEAAWDAGTRLPG